MNQPLGGIGGRTSRYTIMSKHATDIGNIEGGSILINESESAVIYLGDSSVSPMSGIALTPGNTCTWQRTCPAYAVVDDATSSSGILVVSNFVSDIDRAIRDTGSLIDLLAEYTYTDEYTSSITVDVSAYPSIMVEAVSVPGDSMTVDVSFIDPDSGAADEFQALGESVTRYYPVSGRTVVVGRSGMLDHPETIRVWGMQQYVGPNVRPTSEVNPDNIVPLELHTITSDGTPDYTVQYNAKPYASMLVSILTDDDAMTNQSVRFVAPNSASTPITIDDGFGAIQVNVIGETLNVEWTSSDTGKVYEIRAWGVKAIMPGSGGGGGTQDVNIVSPNPVPVAITPSTASIYSAGGTISGGDTSVSTTISTSLTNQKCDLYVVLQNAVIAANLPSSVLLSFGLNAIPYTIELYPDIVSTFNFFTMHAIFKNVQIPDGLSGDLTIIIDDSISDNLSCTVRAIIR